MQGLQRAKGDKGEGVGVLWVGRSSDENRENISTEPFMPTKKRKKSIFVGGFPCSIYPLNYKELATDKALENQKR